MLYLAKSKPIALPRRSAKMGPLAAMGEIGLMETGGRINQFKVAPHVIAANDSIAVGRVNIILSLWRLRRGGCCDGPNWLIIVARAV